MLLSTPPSLPLLHFFFNHPATPEIYTLSLHDALPISPTGRTIPTGSTAPVGDVIVLSGAEGRHASDKDRKSTRLNSSHSQISYAVFCLKKKKNTRKLHHPTIKTTPTCITIHRIILTYA